MFLCVHVQRGLLCCIFRRPHIFDISHSHIIDYPLLFAPPLLCIVSIIPDPPPLSLAHLPLVGLFTIYSTLLHHLSLLSPLIFPSLPSRLSNTEVIVSRKMTADKSVLLFFFIFSHLPLSYILSLLPFLSTKFETQCGTMGAN